MKNTQKLPGRLTLLTLFVFGIWFNYQVTRLEEKGREKGKTAFLVIFGTVITLIPVRYRYGWGAYWWAIRIFAASGAPMVLGSIYRHLKTVELNDQAREKLLSLTNHILNNDAKSS